MAQRGKDHGEQLPQNCQPCSLTCLAHFKAHFSEFSSWWSQWSLSHCSFSLFPCVVSQWVPAAYTSLMSASLSGFGFTGRDASRASGRFALLAAVQR